MGSTTATRDPPGLTQQAHTGCLQGLTGGSTTATSCLLGHSAWGSTWAHSEGPQQRPVACQGLQGDPSKRPWARQGSIPLCLGAARACMGESIAVTGRLLGLAGWVQCSNRRPTGAPRGVSTNVTGGPLVLASVGPPTRLVSHWGSQGGSTTTSGAHKGSQRGILQCPRVRRGSHGGSTKVPRGLTLLSGRVPVPHPGAHHGLLVQVCHCAQGPARSPRGLHHCTCGPAVVRRGVHRSSQGPASARRGGSSATPGGLPWVTIRGPVPLLGALHGLLACFGCLDQGPSEARRGGSTTTPGNPSGLAGGTPPLRDWLARGHWAWVSHCAQGPTRACQQGTTLCLVGHWGLLTGLHHCSWGPAPASQWG